MESFHCGSAYSKTHTLLKDLNVISAYCKNENMYAEKPTVRNHCDLQEISTDLMPPVFPLATNFYQLRIFNAKDYSIYILYSNRILI